MEGKNLHIKTGDFTIQNGKPCSGQDVPPVVKYLDEAGFSISLKVDAESMKIRTSVPLLPPVECVVLIDGEEKGTINLKNREFPKAKRSLQFHLCLYSNPRWSLELTPPPRRSFAEYIRDIVRLEEDYRSIKEISFPAGTKWPLYKYNVKTAVPEENLNAGFYLDCLYTFLSFGIRSLEYWGRESELNLEEIINNWQLDRIKLYPVSREKVKETLYRIKNILGGWPEVVVSPLPEEPRNIREKLKECNWFPLPASLPVRKELRMTSFTNRRIENEDVLRELLDEFSHLRRALLLYPVQVKYNNQILHDSMPVPSLYDDKDDEIIFSSRALMKQSGLWSFQMEER